MAVTIEVLRTAVSERIGRVERWRALNGGENARAFECRAAGRDLVVRLGARREGFEKDAWATRRVAAPAAPVPAVLAIGTVDEAFFCVSERAGGTRFDQCDAAGQRRAAPGVCAAIQAVATVDLEGSEGFGSFDPVSERAPHPTWEAHWRSLLPTDWNGLADRAYAALAEDLAGIAFDAFASRPPVRALVHGDAMPGNLNVTGARVSGLFDWEAAVFGDPLSDVARNVLWAPFSPPAKAVAECAFEQLSGAPAISERMRALVIAQGLWAVEIYRAAGREPESALIMRRLHGVASPAAPLDDAGYWMRVRAPGGADGSR